MYEADGIVYAGEPQEAMLVTGVRDTGETRLVDCAELFGPPARVS